MTPTMRDLTEALITHASKLEANLEAAESRTAKLETENGDLLDELAELRLQLLRRAS